MQGRKTGLGYFFVLFFTAARDANAANASALVDDGQAAAKSDKTRTQHQALPDSGRVVFQGFGPLAGGQTKAGSGVSLIERNIDGMQRRTIHP